MNAILKRRGPVRAVRSAGQVEITLSDSRSVFILARGDDDYENLGERARRRRKTTVQTLLKYLGMHGEAGIASLLEALRKVLRHPQLYIHKTHL